MLTNNFPQANFRPSACLEKAYRNGPVPTGRSKIPISCSGTPCLCTTWSALKTGRWCPCCGTPLNCVPSISLTEIRRWIYRNSKSLPSSAGSNRAHTILVVPPRPNSGSMPGFLQSCAKNPHFCVNSPIFGGVLYLFLHQINLVSIRFFFIRTSLGNRPRSRTDGPVFFCLAYLSRHWIERRVSLNYRVFYRDIRSVNNRMIYFFCCLQIWLCFAWHLVVKLQQNWRLHDITSFPESALNKVWNGFAQIVQHYAWFVRVSSWTVHYPCIVNLRKTCPHASDKKTSGRSPERVWPVPGQLPWRWCRYVRNGTFEIKFSSKTE